MHTAPPPNAAPRRAWLALLALAGLLIGQPARAVLPAPGEPGAIADARYCGEPARTPAGRIKRSQAVLARFAQVFPCPTTLEPAPSCPGWQIDHVIPLASGGCDSPENLQWLPITIKTCPDDDCKDRWERTYHSTPRKPVPLPMVK